MSDDLVQEIDDSLRQDQLRKWWDDYGGYVIAGCILAILVTALVNGWHSWNKKVNQNNTALVLEALAAENSAEVLVGISDNVRPNHRTVALLHAAGLLVEDGKIQEALSHYHGVAADMSAKEDLRDLARLMAVRLEWSQMMEGKDHFMQPDDMMKALKSIWQKTDQPWHGHARVQAALVTAYGLGDFEGAITHLDIVREAPDVPSTLKSRAESLRQVFKVQIASTVAPAADGEKQTEKEGPAG